MTKYSTLERVLHRQFLGDTAIAEVMSKALLLKSKSHITSSRHVFVTGLARSGTTALLNKIDSTAEFASFRYKYMPFIFSPTLAKFFGHLSSRNNLESKERIHGDGILFNTGSPECLDEPYWIKNSPEYVREKKILVPVETAADVIRGYSLLLDAFARLEGKDRVVVKNNNNHLRLPSLVSFFPYSIFLVVFREPLSHANSLLSQHKRFIKLQNNDPFILEYMELLGHWEFGQGMLPFIYKGEQYNHLTSLNNLSLDYWISQWIYTYEWILNTGVLLNKNVIAVCYEDLCSNDTLWKIISQKCLIVNSDSPFGFKLGASNNNRCELPYSENLLNRASAIYETLKNNWID